MVVAFDVPSPFPHRAAHRESTGKRWGFDISRRTNRENLGERVYPWWRLTGRTLRLAGRAYGLGRLATIWHVEPNGHDAGTVCKWWVQRGGQRVHTNRWRWHFWHWQVQVCPFDDVRWWLVRRCALCGRRFPFRYAPISHQWDPPKLRFWQVDRDAYHHECSSVVSLRQSANLDASLIRSLLEALSQAEGETPEQTLDRMTGTSSPMEFNHSYRLQRLMGYERDDDYRLVRTADRELLS